MSSNIQKDYAIGIDLGTTFCCCCVYRNGNVEVIPNQNGNRITPSYISFIDNEYLVGDAAKNNVSMNHLNTVFDIKRLIGRTFNDKYVKNDTKYFPFKLLEDLKSNKVLIAVHSQGEEKHYFPEQLSAILLSQLKYDAESYLNMNVNNAVITVPAYFNNAQREATKLAGEIAGLNVLRIINEPTASALAYGINTTSKNNKENNILVFDFGGGTLDVSILSISDGVFEVKSTSGDTHLGGEDFDNKLVAYCSKEFASVNKLSEIECIELSKDSKALRRLRSSCEIAKKSLSTCTIINIQVDSFFKTIDLNVKITRSQFEELSNDLFKRCLNPLEQALSDAKLLKNDINEIILIGGSTRIPYIRTMLKQFFDGKALRIDINPDEAVAIGASIQAAILYGHADQNLSEMILVDITPLSLGIETIHGEMSCVVERNTQIPCKIQKIYSTETDNQRNVKIKIFEGERVLTKDNSMLGIFELTDLPPMPRGIPKIIVVFDIDENGILFVSATEESTGKTKNIIIKKDNSKLSQEEIQKMITDAKNNSDNDKMIKRVLAVKNSFENYLYSTKRILDNISIQNNSNIIDIQRTIIDSQKWLDIHKNENIEIYNEKYQQVEKYISDLLQIIENNKIINEKIVENTADNETAIIEKPVEEKPVEEKPVEEKPVEEKPVEEKLIEEKPIKEKPIKEKPIKEKLIEEKLIEEKPVEEKPIEEKPVEEKLDEEKLDEEKPVKEKKCTKKRQINKKQNQEILKHDEEEKHIKTVNTKVKKETTKKNTLTTEEKPKRKYTKKTDKKVENKKEDNKSIEKKSRKKTKKDI
jgi:L1 cell adhesion molecule like protein